MPIIVLNNNTAYIYDHCIETLDNLGAWNSQMNCAHIQDCRATTNMPKNIFNPENIKPGDTVVLKNDNENNDAMLVISVSGKNNNKVFCKEIGQELYANCFTKLHEAP